MSTIKSICQNKALYTGCYLCAVLDPSGMEKQHYMLHRMIRMAGCTGASAIQLNLEFAEGVDMVRLGDTIELAREQGLEIVGEPWDYESTDRLIGAGVDAIRISQQQADNLPLASYCAQQDCPLLLSVHSDWEKFYTVYQAVTVHDVNHCLMISPPAGDDNSTIERVVQLIREIKQHFPNTALGYAGMEPDIQATLACYLLGVAVVEKRFTLYPVKYNRNKGLDLAALHQLSRELIQLNKFKKKYADRTFELTGIYAAHNVQAGSIININDVTINKPVDGLPAYRLGEILGKRLYTDITAGQAFQSTHFAAVE